MSYKKQHPTTHTEAPSRLAPHEVQGGRLREYRDDIRQALEVLNAGGVILYPTDTIWGIGCDATNAEAVKRVYEIKHRSDAKALITLIDSEAKLQFYVQEVPEVAWDLLDVADRPLTIIYDGAYNLAPNLLGDNESVGIRISHEKFSQELCARFGKPVVSTSANVSGEPAAATFAQINPAIVQGVDYVVKYRQDDTAPHSASNIIMLSSDGTFKILR